MKRYHFHTSDGRRICDEEGTLLSCDRAAKTEAVRFAGEILKDDSQEIVEKGSLLIEVGDDDNALLFTLVVTVADTSNSGRISSFSLP